MKKRDIIVISIVCIASIMALIIFLTTGKTGNYAHVYLNENEILEIPLNKDMKYVVNGNLCEIEIEVKNGKIGIIKNDCPDHTCIRMGFINNSSRTIVCVPNGITIKVDKKSSKVDVAV